MKSKLYIVVLISFFNSILPFNAQASLDLQNLKMLKGDMSGGGYIIVCKDPATQKESYELLDYFEARHSIRGFKLRDLKSLKGNDVFEQAMNLIRQRLSLWSPYIVNRLEKTIKDFRDTDSAFVSRAVIKDINDAQTIVDPTLNCHKLQIAVQVKDPSPFQYRLLIDKTMWDKLGRDIKIGLIIHEAFYREALGQGHMRSNDVRLINSVLSSEHSLSELELLSLFKNSNIDTCYNLKIQIDYSDFPSEKIHVPVMALTTNLEKIGNRDIKSAQTCKTNNSYEFKFKDGSSLLLDSNVHVTLEKTEETTNLHLNGQNKVHYFGLVHSDSESYVRNNLIFVTSDFHLRFASDVIMFNLEKQNLPKFLSIGYFDQALFSRCGISEFLANKSFIEIESQKLTFKSFSRMDCADDFSITFEGEHLSLKLSGQELEFSGRSFYDQDGLHLIYTGPKRSLVFNGASVSIKKGDEFLFSNNGSFSGIKHN